MRGGGSRSSLRAACKRLGEIVAAASPAGRCARAASATASGTQAFLCTRHRHRDHAAREPGEIAQERLRNPCSPACRRSAPAAATPAPPDRRAPRRSRGRRRDCARRRATASLPAGASATSRPCASRCSRAGQSALTMPVSNAAGGSLNCLIARSAAMARPAFSN